ncbi:hypothetical protein Slin14017_G022040 [Septoria linicola]|nr:hypothetical protein Slin14017_G022040 [Septoria linicola]
MAREEMAGAGVDLTWNERMASLLNTLNPRPESKTWPAQLIVDNASKHTFGCPEDLLSEDSRESLGADIQSLYVKCRRYER